MSSVTLTSAGSLLAAGGFTQDDGALIIFPQSNNQVNFGGSYVSSDIWFGYRAAGSRPKPVNYIFGGTGAAAIYGNTFTAGSSRKIKHDIEPYLKSALDVLNNVDVVSYVYNNDKDEKVRVGFIAEDTDPLLSIDNKHMDINTCIGVLFKAVQELDEKIEDLEKQKEELLNGSDN